MSKSDGWLVSKEKLLAVLKVLGLVAARPGVLTSTFIHMQGDGNALRMRLAAEVCGKVSVRGKGDWPFSKPFYLDRRLLYPFVEAIKTMKTDAPLEFIKNENGGLTILHGRRKAQFDVSADVQGGYGDAFADGRELKVPESLQRLLVCGKECSVSDATIPELNCVYIEPSKSGARVYAGNQIILMAGKVSGTVGLQSALPFPLYLVQFLGVEGLQSISVGPKAKQVMLAFDVGRVWQTVSAVATEKFPVDSIADRVADGSKMDVALQFNAKQMSHVIARLVIYLSSVRREEWLLKVLAKKDDTLVRFTVPLPQGFFSEKVQLSKPAACDVEETWPMQLLMPVFEYIAQEDKETLVSVATGAKLPYSYIGVGDSLKVVVAKPKKNKK